MKRWVEVTVMTHKVYAVEVPLGCKDASDWATTEVLYCAIQPADVNIITSIEACEVTNHKELLDKADEVISII